MVNLRLKKLILEVVDNQLRDNNPPAVKETFDKLIGIGCSAREAKEKIGAVVVEEIYDVMKENQPYDEKRYTDALKNMVQQCINLKDTHEILTEWDEWDRLVQNGYEAQEKQLSSVDIPAESCRRDKRVHGYEWSKQRDFCTV